jgi:hypothetical protein
MWYTADEPDGPGDPLDAPRNARDLIHNELDPYHPVGLVLNCENYHFTEYGLNGADVLLVDVYSVAVNGAWSKKYNTICDEDFGASGCDNCKGSFYDLTGRLDSWRDRIRIGGRSRTLPLWTVPQAFDDEGEEFWWRIPTGDEGAVQIVLAFNHGVMGHCAWLASSATEDLLHVSDPRELGFG